MTPHLAYRTRRRFTDDETLRGDLWAMAVGGVPVAVAVFVISYFAAALVSGAGQ